MKTTIKVVLAILGLTVTALYIIQEFGERESNFICTGTQTSNGIEQPAEFGIRFSFYSWFIMWADSDGYAWLETQNGSPYYFPFLEVGSLYVAFSDTKDRSLTAPFGQISTVTNTVRVGLPPEFSLKGKCVSSPNVRW